MKWKDRRRSSNVEDRRTTSGGRSFRMPSLKTLLFLYPLVKPLLRSKFGIVLIAVGALAYFSGFNPCGCGFAEAQMGPFYCPNDQKIYIDLGAEKMKGILERGDIDEALNAASAIGDDHIQRQTTGYVMPDSFTHGSSKQRMTWFYRGLKSGDLSSCNTFQ